MSDAAQQVIAEMDAASAEFVAGRTGRWKALSAQSDDATLFGAWGGYEKGWEQIEPRYEWAAARFQGGDMHQEIISSGGDDNFLYTVAIERGAVRVAGQEVAAPMALRVTQVYRREDDGWKLVHRHADSLLGEQAPTSILQR